MDKVKEFEKRQISELTKGKKIPDFTPGDTVRVSVKVKEGQRERIQAYEGVCISRKNAGINSAFTVRKISFGEGVERIFPLYAPIVEKIELPPLPPVASLQGLFAPAAPTVIGKVAVEITKPAPASNGLAAYESDVHLPSLNPPAPPPPPAPLEPPPPPATTV